MHATVHHCSRRVVKMLAVDDGPIYGDADTRIKVDVIVLTYADHGAGLNVKASLHGPVLDKDDTPNPTRRAAHTVWNTVWNALAEGGWLRELIDEHTPPEFLPDAPKP